MQGEEKGRMDVSSADVTAGSLDNLKQSGVKSLGGVCMNVVCEDKTMEMVFETVGDAKQFCITLCKVANTISNVINYTSSMQVNRCVFYIAFLW